MLNDVIGTIERGCLYLAPPSVFGLNYIYFMFISSISKHLEAQMCNHCSDSVFTNSLNTCFRPSMKKVASLIPSIYLSTWCSS